MVDEDFLAALRVHCLERHDLHVLLMAYQFAIALDALGLVVLNAEDDARHLQKLLQKPAARNHVERVVDHRARIGGNVGLALRAVDDDALDLVQVLNRELHNRREARAAETHKAARADRVQKVLHGLELGRLNALPARI